MNLHDKLLAAAEFLEGTDSMRPSDLSSRYAALLREAADSIAAIPAECQRHGSAAYAAGQESMRAKLDEQWNDGFDKGKVAGRKAGLEEAAVKCIESMKPYRFDKHTHEGLGDIRLTIGAQEEIAAAIRALSNAD